MYTIDADPNRGLIRVAVKGFWTVDTVAAYQRDLMAAIETLPPDPDGHLTLCDISGSAIQSQEVLTQLQRFIGRRALRSRRIAYVTNTPLVRGQGKRLVGDRADRAVFPTAAEAEAWLAAPDAGT